MLYSLKLCNPFWTFDTMLTQSRYQNGLRRHIGAQKIMHDAMTSILSIKCMAKHREKHIKHNSIISFFAKLEQTWPILTLAIMTAKWNMKPGFQT